MRLGNEKLVGLSREAGIKLSELMEREGNGSYLRIKITGGGCNGLSYKMKFVDDGKDNDKKGEEDYSDLDTHLVEVSDKEEKLLPDEDLKWDEDENREKEATPYQGGAPDEDKS